MPGQGDIVQIASGANVKLKCQAPGGGWFGSTLNANGQEVTQMHVAPYVNGQWKGSVATTSTCVGGRSRKPRKSGRSRRNKKSRKSRKRGYFF
jgi:hypothetical protein